MVSWSRRGKGREREKENVFTRRHSYSSLSRWPLPRSESLFRLLSIEEHREIKRNRGPPKRNSRYSLSSFLWKKGRTVDNESLKQILVDNENAEAQMCEVIYSTDNWSITHRILFSQAKFLTQVVRIRSWYAARVQHSLEWDRAEIGQFDCSRKNSVNANECSFVDSPFEICFKKGILSIERENSAWPRKALNPFTDLHTRDWAKHFPPNWEWTDCSFFEFQLIELVH